ncbi:MAG: sigma-70 family RNA polymerase sigma factor [Planctomycetes bacterium]|nr:sigma-70 family RNA polymerase sigma factor [Planctomycetota bacterium]
MTVSREEGAGWNTTLQVRRAVNGDRDSLGAVVTRLSPVLTAVAEYRLGKALRAVVEPADLVNEAWLIALPKLGVLEPRDGRITPVLLRFLTTTINHRINSYLRRQITRSAGTANVMVADAVDPTANGVVTRAVRNETQAIVRSCLDELRSGDREIVLLRGIEQNASRTVATLLGLSVAAVDQRYSRALKRLRRVLPDSVFAELDPEASDSR